MHAPSYSLSRNLDVTSQKRPSGASPSTSDPLPCVCYFLSGEPIFSHFHYTFKFSESKDLVLFTKCIIAQIQCWLAMNTLCMNAAWDVMGSHPKNFATLICPYIFSKSNLRFKNVNKNKNILPPAMTKWLRAFLFRYTVSPVFTELSIREEKKIYNSKHTPLPFLMLHSLRWIELEESAVVIPILI